MVTTLDFQDIKVPSPGFGAMSLSGMYGSADDEESMKVLKKAVDIGCTFWDTAVIYGFGHNEKLLGRFFKGNPGSREKVFLASKCAYDVLAQEIDFEKKVKRGVDNSAEHIRAYLQDSTERIGSAPDLYYLHRRDPKCPLSESIGALSQLRKEGKVKYIGLSEVSAETLREACKIAHIDALQIEYSAFCLDYETNGLIATATEVGVKVIAFSPLGAGFLTGKYKDTTQFKNDIRGDAGRFAQENLENNMKLLHALERMADKKRCTPAQLALAWVNAQGAIPIPGTRSVERLEENFGATNVEISQDELKEIRCILDQNPVHGGRWGEDVTRFMGK